MESLKNIIQYIDYTTLSESDTPESVTEFTNRAMELHCKGLPRVASICVYPNFVETVGLALGSTGIKITAVCGGFPASQTFIEVKMLEVAMAMENGADEIDVVMNVGAVLSGKEELAGSEIAIIAEEINGDAILKVIIESGILKDPELIYKASMTAMENGADFVKTSTGKSGAGATPNAAMTICRAIKDYHAKTGRKVGLKVSGGVATCTEALEYIEIVKKELGTEWLTPQYFRIGTSRLLDNILKEL